MTNPDSDSFNYSNSSPGAPAQPAVPGFPAASAANGAPELRSMALAALCTPDPEQKALLAGELLNKLATYSIADNAIDAPSNLPGQPDKPLLLRHLDVPKRSPHTQDGLAALVHAVCHIEFNAINLALDAVWRFAGMPAQYYADWVRVAAEEAQHFSLLSAQLQAMGWRYGDFAAHTGLWDMIAKTAGNITARMALVPRTLEARGLDATPPMQAKLRKAGSPDALKVVAILDIILRDEIGHVAIGNHWYRWLCNQAGLEPVAHFKHLIVQYQAPRLRPPFNDAARRTAGFSDEEMQALMES